MLTFHSNPLSIHFHSTSKSGLAQCAFNPVWFFLFAVWTWSKCIEYTFSVQCGCTGLVCAEPVSSTKKNHCKVWQILFIVSHLLTNKGPKHTIRMWLDSAGCTDCHASPCIPPLSRASTQCMSWLWDDCLVFCQHACTVVDPGFSQVGGGGKGVLEAKLRH